MSMAMLEAYLKCHPKLKTIVELKKTLQIIWDSLPQGPTDIAVKEFLKRLEASVEAEDGDFEHVQSMHNSDALLSCLNNVTLLSFARTFLNALKSLVATLQYW